MKNHRTPKPFAAALGLFGLLPLLLLVGCKSQPTNLAPQIGPITTTVEPYTNDKGEAMQQVRFHFKNNGPSDVGVVFARIDAFDASGQKTSDSSASYCIFVADNPSEVLKPGQEYQTPTDRYASYLLVNGVHDGTPAARVEAAAVRAEKESGLPPP